MQVGHQGESRPIRCQGYSTSMPGQLHLVYVGQSKHLCPQETHKMDKNLAPVSTMTTLQLEPRPLKQLQTLPVWIMVPGWNNANAPFSAMPQRKCFSMKAILWYWHEKKNLFTRCENISAETWEPSSSNNLICSKGTQFSDNRPENKKIDKSAKK